MLAINEIFYSLQGEGFWTGIPMVFIRLSGCNLACSWCDTNHQNYTLMGMQEILTEIGRYPKGRVCITGGEPCHQDLKELLSTLSREKYTIHLETNGTVWQDCLNKVSWLTVSPKIQKLPKTYCVYHASEIKIVISTGTDLEESKKYEAYVNLRAYLFVQPESAKPEATTLCVDFCKENPRWRLSLQTHKLINIK